MNCAGTESNLDECRHDSWKSENCGTNEHIYLTCSGKYYTYICMTYSREYHTYIYL